MFSKTSAALKGEVSGHKNLRVAVAQEKASKDHVKGLMESDMDAHELYSYWADDHGDEGIASVAKSLLVLEKEWHQCQGMLVTALRNKKEFTNRLLAAEKNVSDLHKAFVKAEKNEQHAEKELEKARGKDPSKTTKAEAKFSDAQRQKEEAEQAYANARDKELKECRRDLRKAWLEYYRIKARVYEEGAAAARECAEIAELLPEDVDEGFNDTLKKESEQIADETRAKLEKMRHEDEMHISITPQHVHQQA
ncbi:uncharacterized protein MONBRDRAFT_26121 [Monosiga brevicollis MX1]|uniref:F-BAR domain-containing protein n=1 Tax=Monosiga brevicollis TaxID=81824 RepID=A9V1F1_MONBE|nr:uncharacterized protein MONBRDRAFT_26121 [Monosiga brevicollis MX1]EDQ88556.1 predicted protein [Monosiga brevicollis MX1]|eukprot:XP_001746660.1 hypothetical protein [Monosiga brevicollis MX1]